MHEFETLAVMFHGEKSGELHQCLAKVGLGPTTPPSFRYAARPSLTGNRRSWFAHVEYPPKELDQVGVALGAAA